MNTKNKNATKVFLFLVVGLLLLALMIFQFAKTGGWFKPAYTLELMSPNVGGIRNGAGVLMAGIRIGQVKNIHLGYEGKKGIIKVSILDDYKIRSDAIFGMQQNGFLGDQYVSVTAVGTNAPYLEDGAQVECKSPFSIEEIASAAGKLMGTVGVTAESLTGIINKLNHQFLTDETSTNISEVIKNMKNVSKNLDDMTASLNQDAFGRTGTLAQAVTNMNKTVMILGNAAEEILEIASENKEGLHQTITNLAATTAKLNNVMASIDSSNGVLGTLVNNPETKLQFQTTVSNLSILVDGLKKYGVLSYYRKTKNLREEEPVEK